MALDEFKSKKEQLTQRAFKLSMLQRYNQNLPDSSVIKYEREYYQWIQNQGVGQNDTVASSPDSYVSYLTTVSELIGEEISPQVLSREDDIKIIARRLKGKRADKTIRNYKSAMKHYVTMVRVNKLAGC